MKELRLQTTALLILSGLALAFALYWLAPVMIPFVVALFITIGLRPLVDFLVWRARMPHGLAVASTLLLAVLFLVLIAATITYSANEAARNSEVYVEQLRNALALISQELSADQRARLVGIETGPMFDQALTGVGGFILLTTNALLGLISQGVLVIIFVTFLLVGSDGGGRRVRRPRDSTWNEIETRIKRYLAAKALISAATGILVGVSLGLLGVDLALLFGLFSFLLNFVPNVGSIVATLLPLPVVLMNPDMSWTVATLAIAIPSLIQLTFDNVVEPKVMGDRLELHPVTILLALIFWGMLWGLVGMLLATPMTAVMKILFSRLEPTRPLAELMAGNLDAL